MSRFSLIGFAIVSLTVVAAGCGSSDSGGQKLSDVRPITSATPSTLAVRHGVQDARLRAVMDRLSLRNSQTAPPTDMPEDPEEPVNRSAEWYFGEAQTLAADLAEMAAVIPQSVSPARMSDADRAGFEAEAATLRDQALRLRDAASGHKVEQMRHILDGINSTCISCHSRYRDFTGQIDLHDPTHRAM